MKNDYIQRKNAGKITQKILINAPHLIIDKFGVINGEFCSAILDRNYNFDMVICIDYSFFGFYLKIFKFSLFIKKELTSWVNNNMMETNEVTLYIVSAYDLTVLSRKYLTLFKFILGCFSPQICERSNATIQTLHNGVRIRCE